MTFLPVELMSLVGSYDCFRHLEVSTPTDVARCVLATTSGVGRLLTDVFQSAAVRFTYRAHPDQLPL